MLDFNCQETGGRLFANWETDKLRTMKEAFLLLLGAWKVISAPTTTSDLCQYITKVVKVVEEDALHLPCHLSLYKERNATEFSWFKDGTHAIQSSEDQRIHFHGGVLFFLPILLSDTAVYSCYWQPPGKCRIFQFELKVYKANPFDPSVLYTPIEAQELHPGILCPLEKLCQGGNRTLIWYKNSVCIPNMSEITLRIQNASKRDEGLYTCKCSWEHSGKVFTSSASRELIVKAPSVHYRPVIRYPTSNATETAELGSVKTLTCTVFFGINVEDFREVLWHVDKQDLQSIKRYSVKTIREVKDGESVQTVVLTISNVTQDDFREFKCTAKNSQQWVSKSVFLKPRETIHTLLAVSGCILLAFLLAFVVFKCFMIDLVLLFRGVFNTRSPVDGKVYDAYVIYQRHDLEKAVEEKIDNFVSRLLPDVLEKKCGYRLFIHGRDDLPGEDHMELIETRIKLSRRLMVILTLGSGRGHEASANHEDYDRQVGLHQALVKEELKVILIELEKMHGYGHLPQVPGPETK
ncbi:hypothetical protein AAFF_G00209290 [Aldrovandia affinis]|uniref:Interleukin-1 receptor-like 1 n=1 Tax=Aldrovandia affinis TaxID=143900 RepID=A0AAD7WUV4_9TELE|nr:hypothetical protein AAFF_G00209290 [Aldrovandia affinis]